MNIGEPLRIIEVEPLWLPVPIAEPAPAEPVAPTPQPTMPEPEPAVPAR